MVTMDTKLELMMTMIDTCAGDSPGSPLSTSQSKSVLKTASDMASAPSMETNVADKEMSDDVESQQCLHTGCLTRDWEEK